MPRRGRRPGRSPTRRRGSFRRCPAPTRRSRRTPRRTARPRSARGRRPGRGSPRAVTTRDTPPASRHSRRRIRRGNRGWAHTGCRRGTPRPRHSSDPRRTRGTRRPPGGALRRAARSRPPRRPLWPGRDSRRGRRPGRSGTPTTCCTARRTGSCSPTRVRAATDDGRRSPSGRSYQTDTWAARVTGVAEFVWFSTGPGGVRWSRIGVELGGPRG